ncbi:MAG: hypothetical protein ACXVQ6_04295 [Actinomycetota bacterium]
MEGSEPPREDIKRARSKRWMTSAALVASGLVAGGVLAGTHIAGAATTPSSSATGTATAPADRPDPATVSHGPNETLLTDGNATKAAAAAKAAVPGATIIRVETDSVGATYEAHMKKADGSYVTVKMDSSFKVTSTEDGFGAGPHGMDHSAPQSNA